ncbi:MAG: FtsX-like permease family protein [Lachnospiraceae bacterium]|nr:FtsX-like permease family protein [Lachnospiraceae bacterium]
MEILILIKANLRRRQGTYLGIMLLTVLIACSAGAILSVMENSERALDAALEHSDSGDVAVFMSSEVLTDTLRSELEGNKLVERVRYLDAAYADSAKCGEKVYANGIFLTKLRDGILLYNSRADGFTETIPPLKEWEVYLPLGMKAKLECEPGDTIQFFFYGKAFDFRIAGFVQEPAQGAANIGWKQVFISGQALYTILDECSKENIFVDITIAMIYKAAECPLSAAKFSRQLNLETKIIANAMGALTKADTIRYTMILWQVISCVLLLFVGLLFVIVLIVMGHSILTEVELDYVNLGILKSQGFSNRKIRRILLAGYLLCELAGGLAGSLLALPLSLFLGRQMMQNTAILPNGGLSCGKLFLVLLAILLVSAVMVGIQTQKVGKISPIRAISGGKPEIYFDSRLLLPIRRRGLFFLLALRQLVSGKKRYLGTVFIVAILTFFMFSINLIGDLFNSKAALEAMGTRISEIEIRCLTPLDDATEKEIEALVTDHSPIRKKYYTHMDYMSVNGENLRCECHKYPEYINGIQKGRAPMYDNEILITEMVAEILEIGVGDTVTVSKDELEAEFMISGIYQCAYDSGMTFALSLDGAKKLGVEHITYIEFCLLKPEQSGEIVEALNRKFGDRIEAKLFDFDASIMNDGMIDSVITSLRAVIYIFSVLFALIVVEMVCSKSFSMERTDIGILRAVGFSVAGLRLSFALRFFVISLPGSALGMVLSSALSPRLIGGILGMVGFSKVELEFTFLTVLIPVLLMGVCFFTFAYAAAHRIKRVAVRELVVE